MADGPLIPSETSLAGFAPWDDLSSTTVVALNRVATGLGLLYYTLALSVLATIGLVILQFVMRKDPLVATVSYVLVSMQWVAMALDLIGVMFCLAAPAGTAARNLIYGSVIFKLAGLSLTIARMVVGGLPWAMESIQTPIGIVTFILFVLFLRKLAIYLGVPKLVGRARNILIAGFILLGSIMVLIPAFASRAHNPDPGHGALMLVLGLIAAVSGSFVFIKYLSLLRDLRTAIRVGGVPK